MVENYISKIEDWAKERGLIPGSTEKQCLKLGEEFGELCKSIIENDKGKTIDAIGDCFVVIAILCKQLGLNLEDCINHAWNEIKDRKGKCVGNVFIKESSN